MGNRFLPFERGSVTACSPAVRTLVPGTTSLADRSAEGAGPLAEAVGFCSGCRSGPGVSVRWTEALLNQS